MQEDFIHYFPGKTWSNTYGILLCEVGVREKCIVHEPHPLYWQKTWLGRCIQTGVLHWEGLKMCT
jgi:hypothetical protein